MKLSTVASASQENPNSARDHKYRSRNSRGAKEVTCEIDWLIVLFQRFDEFLEIVSPA